MGLDSCVIHTPIFLKVVKKVLPSLVAIVMLREQRGFDPQIMQRGGLMAFPTPHCVVLGSRQERISKQKVQKQLTTGTERRNKEVFKKTRRQEDRRGGE